MRGRCAARAVPDGNQLEGFVDTGVERAGQGERLGVAYRLADGRRIYVPDGKAPPVSSRAELRSAES